MVKVTITPVYDNQNDRLLAIKKTIKFLGLTIFKKIIKPISKIRGSEDEEILSI
jgi:hypothetical protein